MSMSLKSQFIKHVTQICESTDLENMGIKKYKIYEKQDIENPKWTKIILDIEFTTNNIDDNIKSWEDLRHIIDESFNTDINIKKYRHLFYIQPIF